MNAARWHPSDLKYYTCPVARACNKRTLTSKPKTSCYKMNVENILLQYLIPTRISLAIKVFKHQLELLSKKARLNQ
ncbi:MAG: hypothetical protein ACTSWN_02835 [Promethearchaeota archaeon]